MNTTIFDFLYEKYKPKNKIRLIELNNLEIVVTREGEIYTKNKNKIRINGRKDNRKGKLLKPAVDKDGYLRITLSNEGKRKSYYVHRLVARAYLKNYSEALQVNHKNGKKQDNNIENLEIVTLQQNIRHSIEKGLKPKLKRDKLGRFCGKESDNNEELNNI